jgi:hypothetical protein
MTQAGRGTQPEMWPVDWCGILTQVRQICAEGGFQDQLLVELEDCSVQQRKAYLVCRFLYS